MDTSSQRPRAIKSAIRRSVRLLTGQCAGRNLGQCVGRKWAHERETSGIARVGSGEWANVRACPGGNYMRYILEKCMHVRGGMEGLKSDIKMVLK